MSSNRSIPVLRGVPVLGNALRLAGDVPTDFLVETADEHPEGIYQLEVLGRHPLFVYDPDLVAEVCDETRFYKSVGPPLAMVRDFAGDGLFTVPGNEPVWGHAHRILMPAFGQRSMRAYFPQMLEVAQDLVASWARRQGADLPVSDDMTRLTLDTIALTGFGYRFGSFSSPELHPFLQAMGNALTEAMVRARQPQVVTRMRARREETYRADIRAMQDLVDDVIRRRRAGDRDGGGTDLLGLMLDATDPRTGERLPDENIRDQVLTFLIAGHETTSGLLSFALYNLLRNPHVLARAYAEVDRLLPDGATPSYETIMKLDVIPRVLEETLRLWSPIPGIILKPFADTEIGGGYRVRKGQQIFLLLPVLHRHPRAWDRPDEFDIDRWLPERRAGHHPAGYKPFGNGERACIGRQFALTEARLALAMVLQRFAISDPHAYRMQIKQTLTLKPDGFTIRVRERRPHERGTAAESLTAETSAEERVEPVAAGTPLTVAYGSNLGTCAAIAERLAERAGRSGCAVTLVTLDELAADPPREGVLVVVAASYNGRAPDNAQVFDARAELRSLDGVRLALLGCGDTQWPTYQAFPRRAFDKLTRAGAVPLVERGEADAAGDFDGGVTAWTTALWAALTAEYGTAAAVEPRYEMDVLTEADVRPAVISAAAVPLTVLENRELTGDPAGLWDFSLEPPRPGVRSITAALPEGISYTAGDHLAVFPKNDPEQVERALHLLGVPRDLVVRLRARGATHLPVDTPVTAGLLLSEFTELREPATRADLETIAARTECPHTRRQLAALADAYADEILAKHVCVLDLLERFPAVTLPLPVFLETTGPIRPRYYSISSAPSADPGRVRLTVGLVDGPARSGTGRYRGTCSAYMAGLAPGEVFYGHVRTPAPPFRLPADPSVPLILIGPGTGIAPLRGFLDERARTGATGPIELFTGCRHPGHDRLYGTELDTWQDAGLVRVHTAFSALPGHPIRFVQEAVAAEADRVWTLLEAGAHVYVCGDGLRMAPAVRETLAQIYTNRTGRDGARWLAALAAEGRFHQDIFA